MFAEDISIGRKAIENYKSIGQDHVAELTSPEVGKARFGGFFEDANWTETPSRTGTREVDGLKQRRLCARSSRLPSLKVSGTLRRLLQCYA